MLLLWNAKLISPGQNYLVPIQKLPLPSWEEVGGRGLMDAPFSILASKLIAIDTGFGKAVEIAFL